MKSVVWGSHSFRYELYVEGQLVEQFNSYKKANKLRVKYENEGWNVKLVEFRETIIGDLGVEV